MFASGVSGSGVVDDVKQRLPLSNDTICLIEIIENALWTWGLLKRLLFLAISLNYGQSHSSNDRLKFKSNVWFPNCSQLNQVLGILRIQFSLVVELKFLAKSDQIMAPGRLVSELIAGGLSTSRTVINSKRFRCKVSVRKVFSLKFRGYNLDIGTESGPTVIRSNLLLI